MTKKQITKWKCQFCEKYFHDSDNKFELSGKDACTECYEEWLLEDTSDLLPCGCCKCCGCDCDDWSYWGDEEDE